MSFQYIFDNAAQIRMDTHPVVAQSRTRSNVVKSVERGGDTWRFIVTMPQGQKWSEVRSKIALIEALGKTTSDTIQINNAGYNDWLTAYQGDSDVTAGFQVNTISGKTCQISTYGAGHNLTASEYTFKAGDLIQLGSGHTYKVAADVIYPATTVTLNRTIIESDATYSINIGPACSFTVKCTTLPAWIIFDRDLVQFNGQFVFEEDI